MNPEPTEYNHYFLPKPRKTAFILNQSFVIFPDSFPYSMHGSLNDDNFLLMLNTGYNESKKYWYATLKMGCKLCHNNWRLPLFTLFCFVNTTLNFNTLNESQPTEIYPRHFYLAVTCSKSTIGTIGTL